jgi:hypothetical protein
MPAKNANLSPFSPPNQMKITKMLVSKMNFFTVDWKLAICRGFASAITGKDASLFNMCRITFSTKDQKEKGYRKITWKDATIVAFKKEEFVLCMQEQNFLKDAGLQIGDCFWVKIELA